MKKKFLPPDSLRMPAYILIFAENRITHGIIKTRYERRTTAKVLFKVKKARVELARMYLFFFYHQAQTSPPLRLRPRSCSVIVVQYNSSSTWQHLYEGKYAHFCTKPCELMHVNFFLMRLRGRLPFSRWRRQLVLFIHFFKFLFHFNGRS